MKYLTLPVFCVLFLAISGCCNSKSPQVQLDEIIDEGQDSYRVTTQETTWVFHKTGAGFSSILDADGNDWLNYHPEGGPAGHYRGTPNAVFNYYNAELDNFFHAGHTGKRASVTTVVTENEDQVILRSASHDGRWECEWEILPDRAVFSMLRIPEDADSAYWMLYEGTPGGQFSNEDLCLRSDGTLTTLADRWEASMTDISWVAFISKTTGRSLLVISDRLLDKPLSYWPMEESMTVFGFGRDLGRPICRLKEPMSFTVALIDESNPDRIPARVADLQGQNSH